jgi:hypothetical protein
MNWSRTSFCIIRHSVFTNSDVIQKKSIHPEDVPTQGEPEYELRRVKRRPGRRDLANFENLPVTTQV